MAITVTKLIKDAYCDSSVVARQFETLQGYQLNDGLEWLNQILGDKQTDSGDIPYITMQYPLTGIVGQETYFIPNAISIDAMTFYIGSVRYQMRYVDRVTYFGQPRANNINSLPVSYTYERVFGGIKVWVYFWPDKPYLFNITGNFFMQNVSLNQDLTSKIAVANLGLCSVFGAGTLTAGQLVVNDVDLAGTYATAAALKTYINTGVIPFVTATITGNNQFTLTCASGADIVIETLGTESSSNYITFAYFSTISGLPLSQTFFAQALDQFYINFLEYELAEKICEKLNFALPEGVARKLDVYRKRIINLAEPLDLRIQKLSTMTDSRAINYGAVNLGRGYTVGGI